MFRIFNSNELVYFDFTLLCSAQAAKLLCEEQQGVSANTVKYVGYCSYHWNKKVTYSMDQTLLSLLLLYIYK